MFSNILSLLFAIPKIIKFIQYVIDLIKGFENEKIDEQQKKLNEAVENSKKAQTPKEKKDAVHEISKNSF